MEYRDKDDKRELPEIPKRYDSDFLELLKYLQFEGARATLKLVEVRNERTDYCCRPCQWGESLRPTFIVDFMVYSIML